MKLQPGKYFIGDPCYVIKDELWSDYCEALWEAEKKQFEGFFDFKGIQVFVSSTAHGDGSYEDERGRGEFSVDAGLIGATPLDKGITEADIREDLGVIVTYNEPFKCYYLDDAGGIDIGEFRILTDIYEDEYDDDDDDDRSWDDEDAY